MGETYTNLQVWKVLRELVKENNSTFRKIYASSVRGYINGYIQRNGLSPKMAEIEKNKIISSGMSEIYEAVATRFLDIDRFEHYPEGTQQATYFDLKAANKNWYDKLSVKDLFVLFTFQNKVISQIRKEKNLDSNSFVSIIGKTGFIRAFRGEVQFTGRPHAVEADKTKIDLTNPEVQTEIIGSLTQHFCGTTQQAINGVALGRHGGEIVRRYFVAREQGQDYSQQRTSGVAMRIDKKKTNILTAQQQLSMRVQQIKEEQAKNPPRQVETLASANVSFEEAIQFIRDKQRESRETREADRQPVFTFTEEQSGKGARKLDDSEEAVVPFTHTEFVYRQPSFEEMEVAQQSLYPIKTMIGLDVQGTPVFEVTDINRETTYETSLGVVHNGPVFREDDNDQLEFVGEFGDDKYLDSLTASEQVE